MTTRPPRCRTSQPPDLRQAAWLLARFLPFYLRHLVLQPYRNRGRLDCVREVLTNPARCHQIAVYDAVLELILNGYAELAGHRLSPQTGHVAVMLTRIGFAFDDEYERQTTASGPPGFEDLLHSPHVQERVLEWRDFMQQFETYSAIRDFLMDFVAHLYKDYAETAAETVGPVSSDAIMKGATLDSGGLLVALAQVVGQFHAAPAESILLAQFSCVGVNGKLADDVIDFRLDVTDQRPNLLLALAREDGAEYARALGSVATAKTMSTRWWRRNCPRTYRQLAGAYEEHQARITSAWLRYASSLMWVPALLGHARKKETRGRI